MRYAAITGLGMANTTAISLGRKAMTRNSPPTHTPTARDATLVISAIAILAA